MKLKTLLTEEFIRTNVNVSSWQDALYIAGDILIEKGFVTEEFVESMEETIMNYGPYVILVPKVAFFHGAPGPNVKNVCISLITFDKPVYFKEFENQQINCAFAFGAIDNESHLEILQDVAKLFQDPSFLTAITSNADKKTILELIRRVL